METANESALLVAFEIEVLPVGDPSALTGGDVFSVGVLEVDEATAKDRALECVRALYAVNPKLVVPPLFAHVRGWRRHFAIDEPFAGVIYQVSASFTLLDTE